MKDNKKDKKHPLTDKVEKAFKGKKNTETGKKYPSDAKPGYSSRGKEKPTSGGTRYAGAGKNYKNTEKTESGNSKSKPGTRPGSGPAKGRKPADADNRVRKTDGDRKRSGTGDRKPPFGTKPRTGTGKTFDDRKRPDSRKDKPERGNREAPKKFKESPTEKRTFRKNPEDTKGKTYGNKDKASERYKRRSTTSSGVLKKKVTEDDGLGLVRLNRYIANSGICSRRDADELIAQGLVEVNGKVITEMGYKVQPGDVVRYDGGTLKREQPVYLLLNKPKDFITTMDDPQERKTVMQLISGACKERVYPVGRLDRNTTGLLLLTNDGELAEKLTHPSNKISKVYQVELNRPLERSDFDTIVEGGILLEDGPVKVDEIAYSEGSKKVLGLEIHEGRNRIVRRIFEHLGYEVERLDRTMYAGLTKKDLPRGNWRFLTEKEVIKLKYQK